MAVRTNYELFDILTNEKDFSISATDLNNNTQTIITSANAVQYMLHKYGTRQYSVLRGMDPATKTEAFNDFSLDFRLWVSNRQHNIDLQYQALFDYDFSPIENVDRYESETINRDDTTTYGKTNTVSGTDTTTYGRTDTRTIDSTTDHNGSDTVTKNGAEINETTKAAFNAPNSYTPETKTTTTYDDVAEQTAFNSGTTEDTSDTNVSSGSDSLSKSETAREGGTDTTDSDTLRTLRVHGNVGITSNATLLHETLELRTIALAEMLLDNFINDYTYYS